MTINPKIEKVLMNYWYIDLFLINYIIICLINIKQCHVKMYIQLQQN